VVIESFELFQKLLIAIALGIIIGVERESRKPKEELVAGVRTFTLVSMLGFFSAFLFSLTNLPEILYLSFLGIIFLSSISYYVKFKRSENIGLTTHIALFLMFFTGLIAFYDTYPFVYTITIGLITALILVIREYTKQLAKNVLLKELRAIIIFGIVAFVLLPIMPNKPLDPFGIINPFIIWLALTFLLFINFLGYLGIKFLGHKGFLVCGSFGGLFSSTALTWDMSSKVRRDKKFEIPAALSISLASSTMYLRVLLIIFIMNFGLAFKAFLPFLLLGIIGYLSSFIFFRKKKFTSKEKIKVESPLELGSAIKYILIFISILVLSALAVEFLGKELIYLISFASGLVSLDAVTIYFSTFPIQEQIAIKGILLATIANTFFKWLIAYFNGNKNLAKRIGYPFLVLAISSIIFFFLI